MKRDKLKLTVEQQALVESARPWVVREARDLGSMIRSFAIHVDAIAEGNAGLVEAAFAFDPTHGAPFERFARSRVRGAILDAIRRELGQRKRLSLAARLAGTDHLGFGRRRGDVLTDTQESLQRELDDFSDGHAASMFAAIVGESQRSNAEDELLTREGRERALRELEGGLKALVPRDRDVVELHYLKGYPLTEVAKRLRISYPTVNRARKRGVERLGALLQGAGVTGVPPGGLEEQ